MVPENMNPLNKISRIIPPPPSTVPTTLQARGAQLPLPFLPPPGAAPNLLLMNKQSLDNTASYTMKPAIIENPHFVIKPQTTQQLY
jgi:hypothetical protein